MDSSYRNVVVGFLILTGGAIAFTALNFVLDPIVSPASTRRSR